MGAYEYKKEAESIINNLKCLDSQEYKVTWLTGYLILRDSKQETVTNERFFEYLKEECQGGLVEPRKETREELES